MVISESKTQNEALVTGDRHFVNVVISMDRCFSHKTTDRTRHHLTHLLTVVQHTEEERMSRLLSCDPKDDQP